MIHAKSAELGEPVTTSVAEPVGSPAGPRAQRFFHLDALRAALMFWGILVHSSTLDPGSNVFRSFAVVSGLVRMEAFFVISGFLAYMLLKKYGAMVTVKKRLLAIGVPFVTALVVLNPVTNFLIYTYHNGPISFLAYLTGEGITASRGPMNWHLHLWFLLALFVYSLLAPAVQRIIDLGLVPGRFSIRPPGLAFLAMCAGVTAGCLASRIGFEMVKDALPEGSHYVIRSIGNFLPFYILGMLLFASPRLREVFSKVHWLQVIVSCSLLFFVKRHAGTDPGRMLEVMILCLESYVAISLSSLLFWAAGKLVRGENETARLLSDAAYSVYLFHFLSIYFFAHLLRGVVPGSMLLLSLVAVATFFVTLAMHRIVISRVPVLALLFNGKPLRRSK